MEHFLDIKKSPLLPSAQTFLEVPLRFFMAFFPETFGRLDKICCFGKDKFLYHGNSNENSGPFFPKKRWRFGSDEFPFHLDGDFQVNHPL